MSVFVLYNHTHKFPI